MDKYPILFAPLQGYTEDVYRRLHNEIFGGVTSYTTPFMRIEHGEPRSKDLRDVRPEFNEGVNVVPQIIASDAKEMEALLDVLLALNYKRVDVNMGCPFPLQTRHGRGAGLLAHPDRIAEIADVMRKHSEVAFSVKMRLGLNDRDEWKNAMPILNELQLDHITVHPRIATQQYKGEVDRDALDSLLSSTSHRIVYNGDIASVSDIDDLQRNYGSRFSGVMIGRGLLARPSLAEEYANDEVWSDGKLKEKIRLIHDKMHEHYTRVIPGESQQLSKLRSFWDYLEPTIGRKQWKKIVKAGNMKNYLAAVAQM